MKRVVKKFTKKCSHDFQWLLQNFLKGVYAKAQTPG